MNGTYAMACDIHFPESRGRRDFHLRRATSIHTEKGWKEFSGMAEIVLPRNVRDFPEVERMNLFEVGDPVVIRFGYGAGQLPEEFTGYISEVADGIPYRLRCEDEMFALRRGTVNVSRAAITLRELLKALAPGYTVECPDIPLGTVRYTEVAPIEVLENLKKELGIHTYFDGRVLHAVDGYSNGGATRAIVLERDAVEENIDRKKAADDKVTVKFKSLQKNGRYLTVEAGDKNGTVQTRTWPYLTEAEIRERVQRIIELEKAKGFEGTVTLFGLPHIRLGMKVDLRSQLYKKIEGVYHIDKVEKEFSRSAGIRQTVTLGAKAVGDGSIG